MTECRFGNESRLQRASLASSLRWVIIFDASCPIVEPKLSEIFSIFPRQQSRNEIQPVLRLDRLFAPELQGLK